MNEYVNMRRRHEREISEFPMFFAFNHGQFRDGMKSLGLKEDETHKIYALGKTGGFYRRSDADRLRDMFSRQEAEIDQAISADKDGTGFIYEMFTAELCNHEYSVTYDLWPVLSVFGFDEADIEGNPALKRGLEKAVHDVLRAAHQIDRQE